MKKIILATDAWHPQVSGVVRCVEEAKKYLEENGFEVTLIHHGMFKTFPVFFYPEIRLSLFPGRKVSQIFKQVNPDYVHIFTEGTIGLATRSFCVKNNLKFTTSYHTHYQYYIEQYFKRKVKFLFDLVYAYLRKFHNKSSGTMAITQRFIQNLKQEGFTGLRLWKLGVDTDLFKRNENSPVKQEYGFKSPVFVYFGRVAKEKNIQEYLDLDLPGTKLVIGEGPWYKELKAKYGQKVVFVGYRKGQELVDFLSVADVFVFPSLTDTFPLAIIEAFSMGLPVAGHNVMDLDELVKEDVGCLDKDLKKAAMECLKISSQRCREYALGFSWKESINKYFIKNLVDARTSSNQKKDYNLTK